MENPGVPVAVHKLYRVPRGAQWVTGQNGSILDYCIFLQTRQVS